MSSPQWLFGGFRLDPDNACLWRGVQAIALTPKAFDVLHYLVTHPDRLVSKDTLLDAVWPETAISDTVVRIAIGELRRALGDTAQAPRFIATVHRRGYRFLAPVTVTDVPEPAPGEAPRRRATPALSPHIDLPSGPDIPVHQEEVNAWRCAMCQHPQSRAARFCVACGAPHVEICRACGQAVPMPATFCPGCGHRLEALLPTEPAPVHWRLWPLLWLCRSVSRSHTLPWPWSRKSVRPVPPWKASRSRSRCCLRISKTPLNSSVALILKPPSSSWTLLCMP